MEDAKRRRKKADDPPPPAEQKEQCPVVALGHYDGAFYFLDTAGVRRRLTARALGSRSELTGLFIGSCEWLESQFIQRRSVKETIGGETVVTQVEIGFNAADACAFLMRECGAAGIYGDHIVIRGPGIWRDEKGAPVAHCGTDILIGGEWRRSALRIGDTVWVTGARTPRPNDPCGVDVGNHLQSELQRLWLWKNAGGAIITLGVLATGQLGAAPEWRPDIFLRAPTGSGKSMLMNVMRACAAIHHYTNETSAAGVYGAMNGRAMQVFIDEPTDRVDQEGARKLMDLVLSASGGEGTKGHRGLADGGARSFEMVGSFVYAATSPPELEPQHLGRITMVDLVAPPAGADNRAPMEALAAYGKEHSTALWGRILAHWPEWQRAAAVYRTALAAVGCAAREMDQMSAILAGWWIITEDGVPTPREARIGVVAIRDFVRVAEDVADDSGPRRVIEHLLGKRIQYDGTTRQEQIGTLISRVFRRYDQFQDKGELEQADKSLGRHGIRVICANDEFDHTGRAVPRAADGDGLWLLPKVAGELFEGSRYEGDRWRIEMLRLPSSAGPSKFTIRVGGVPGKPIWIGRADIAPVEPVAAKELCLQIGISISRLLGLIDKYPTRLPVAQRDMQRDEDPLKHWLFDPAKVAAFVKRVDEKERPG
nr:ATP-binding protein [uncultured Rhodopila sp.]